MILPEGCKDKLNFDPYIESAYLSHFEVGERLSKKLHNYKSKHIIRLHSTKEVESFLAQLEAQTNEKNNSARIPSTPRNRQLALARR